MNKQGGKSYSSTCWKLFMDDAEGLIKYSTSYYKVKKIRW